MIFAIVLLPLLTVVGVALDVSRVATAKTHAASALDAASLAAAKLMSDTKVTDTEITQYINSMYAADLASGHRAVTCGDPVTLIDRASGRIELKANCTMPTTVAGIVRAPTMDVNVASTAVADISTLDLAMMLDVSGSMSGSKLDALKSAASDAIDTMITDRSGDRVRISLVPYSNAVNVGDFGDVAKGKSLGLGNNGNGNGNANGNVNGLGNGNGNGNAYGHAKKDCASERTGPDAFKKDKPAVGGWIGDKASVCPDQGITPILSDKDVLIDTVNNLQAGGTTAGHLGVAWSWYTISKQWDDLWPSGSAAHPVGTKNNTRAVILMTDGAFNTVYEPSLGSSFDQAVALCDEMKKDDVVIFAVAFEAPAEGQAVLQACATSADHYFTADDDAALKDAYQSIASKLTRLRLKS